MQEKFLPFVHMSARGGKRLQKALKRCRFKAYSLAVFSGASRIAGLLPEMQEPDFIVVADLSVKWIPSAGHDFRAPGPQAADVL